jgi:hypothetical protein
VGAMSAKPLVAAPYCIDNRSPGFERNPLTCLP